MTSGEAAMHAINKNQFGKSFFHLGPPRDTSVFEKVKNNQVDLENCDFILVTGSLYLCGNILSHLEIGADIL